MKSIILTGCTGILGKFLFNDLLKSNCDMTLLIRSDSQSEAEIKANNVLKLDSGSSRKIRILKSNLNQENLGLENQVYSKLTESTTHILHSAATTEFTHPLNVARKNNVETTMRLLNFAKDCNNLERFGFVSTAFVAGKRSGLILEEDFEHKSGFLNTYEQSKYEAEALVRTEIRRLPIAIFRPSLIVAPFRKTGMGPISALILGLLLVKRGFLPILPGKEKNVLDIIEGSVAAKAIAQIFFKKTLGFSTYHVTSAKNSPTIKDLIRDYKRSIRFCGDMEQFTDDINKLTVSRPDLIISYKKTETFLTELAIPKIFDNKNLMKELGIKSFSPQPILALRSLLK